jgi:hypothetical protein
VSVLARVQTVLMVWEVEPVEMRVEVTLNDLEGKTLKIPYESLIVNIRLSFWLVGEAIEILLIAELTPWPIILGLVLIETGTATLTFETPEKDSPVWLSTTDTEMLSFPSLLLLSVRVARILLREDNVPVKVRELVGDLPPPLTVTPDVGVTFNKPLLSFSVKVRFEVDDANANGSVIVKPDIGEGTLSGIVFIGEDMEGGVAK